MRDDERPHGRKSQNNSRYDISDGIFVEIDVLVSSNRNRIPIKIHLAVASYELLLVIHEQRIHIVVLLRIIPEVHDLLISVAHLIEISDRHWICPVYLDDTLECLASLVISSLVDEQKCKEQVPLYKSAVVGKYLSELYKGKILAALLRIYQRLIILSGYIVHRLQPVWVGFYLLDVSLGDILAVKIIHAHYPVAERLNYLSGLIVHQSKKVPGIYIHLVILQRQLERLLRT